MSSTQPPNSTSAHNTYQSLVQDDEDLIGLVAYSLYKRDKLHFVEHYRQTEGREPTGTEVCAFITGAKLKTSIESYRSDAEVLLEIFSENILKTVKDRLEDQYSSRLTEELKAGKSFWRAVGENIVANFASIIVTAGLILVISMNKKDPVQVISDALNYEVRPKEASASTPSVATPSSAPSASEASEAK
ncbi:MAG TPA: hypothetical protein VFW93_07990 [Aquabacterium sp.]|uniref:hypothetical protein n=1 Tax=Aquabacterium sp. TaxID=1872578 RepID=UPI002E2FE63C|nr:hypothetical protein [Aquabacterium sp.]HEX5356143.1 hypothetical protein [Aquabacterium sp.]